jgi:spermidine synthase
MEQMQKTYLYITVFSTGLTALAVELSASRLLGGVFGTSNLVWATIIGLILVYLAAGYLLGGYWADHSPHAQTMYSVLAWAALTAGLVPFAARPVLRLAADAFDQLQVGILFGSFSAVLVLFCIPVTLMGMISPFALRLAIGDVQSAGKVSGRLYSISTLGSFIGTFLPPLVLIPLLGTTQTFLSFSLFLCLVALVGLWVNGARKRALLLAWMPLLIVILIVLSVGKPIKASQGQIYETESAYNYIQVLEQNSYRLLRLNEGQGIHSIWHPTELDYKGPWEQFMAAPFYNPGIDSQDLGRIAIVGLAAGTLARQASAVFGPVPIDGFEIDPKIIEVGREFFGMNQPNLNAIAQDGRWGIAHSPQTYDLVAIDAYRPPYIPWHLTTREFFLEVSDHLSERGVVAMNVGSDPGDPRLLEGLAATLSSVFPSVYMMEIPNTFNFMLYATKQPTRLEDLYANYVSLATREDVHPLLLEALKRLIENQQEPGRGGEVFTDDRSPVEWITNNMVLSYLFWNEEENILR